MKNTNNVGHVSFDFRTKNIVNVSWRDADLLFLNLLEEEFDTGWILPEIPEYLEFNNIKYTQFSDKLIEDILKNRSIKSAFFMCDTKVWEGKSYWVRSFRPEGCAIDFLEESLRDLKG